MTLSAPATAIVHSTVERVALHFAGDKGNAPKDDRFANVLCKNGVERRTEAGDC